jgi:hypothetical protein
MSGRGDLFDERHFSWPDLPGDPEKEAGLPWFWFLDVGEARAYLGLFTLVNLLWVGMVVSFWIMHSRTLWTVLVVPAAIAWVAYLRLWIGLCRRVRPPLPPLQWFMAGWVNRRVRHCLQLARDLVADR